jgi:hypothetical protein
MSETAIQSRVLLLNGNTWEPLSVITIPRAINLILAGKAVVVEQSGDFLRTVRDKINGRIPPAPAITATTGKAVAFPTKQA